MDSHERNPVVLRALSLNHQSRLLLQCKMESNVQPLCSRPVVRVELFGAYMQVWGEGKSCTLHNHEDHM